jgi:DNA-binding response OmpR family regulator
MLNQDNDKFNNMKIFILEDDLDQSELYSFWLDEYECHTFDKARDLIKQIPFEKPDVLLIDWNLPKVDGMDVLHWLKGSVFLETPVIFLTSRSTEEDIVKALTDGADDYIVKPASAAILKARIKAVTRRMMSSDEEKEFLLDKTPYSFNHISNSVSYLNNKSFLSN